ncbi:hypothetical protein ACWEO4_36575 [Streptomyces sp. NPDC004393]|uniref:hypothetical protein n=1 Tax=Streptomyces sp. NPDC004533 TaxID=3154278 RepID=UPI0033A162CD
MASSPDPSASRLLDTVSAVVIDSTVPGNNRHGADGRRLDPLTAPVLAADHATGVTILLSEGRRVGDMLSPAEELLGRRECLVDQVCALRNKDHAVLMVSGTHTEAPAAGTSRSRCPMPPGAETCWSADPVCVDGLEDVWRILHAVPAARTVSRHSVQPALAGSAAGTLLALTAPKHGFALIPVHTVIFVPLPWAVVAARRSTRAPRPARRHA